MEFASREVVSSDELMKGIGSAEVVESKIGFAGSLVGSIVVVWEII